MNELPVVNRISDPVLHYNKQLSNLLHFSIIQQSFKDITVNSCDQYTVIIKDFSGAPGEMEKELLLKATLLPCVPFLINCSL